MIGIARHSEDAPEFIERVERLIRGIAAQHRPPTLTVVRIDNWFGHRWLEFSGKTLGAFGVANAELTVPPFHPNRVVSQASFECDNESGAYEPFVAPPLHLKQTSSDNLIRFLDREAPDTALIWFSGSSAPNGPGAVMAYVPGEDGHTGWYCGFSAADGEWAADNLVLIDRVELEHLEATT